MDMIRVEPKSAMGANSKWKTKWRGKRNSIRGEESAKELGLELWRINGGFVWWGGWDKQTWRRGELHEPRRGTEKGCYPFVGSGFFFRSYCNHSHAPPPLSLLEPCPAPWFCFACLSPLFPVSIHCLITHSVDKRSYPTVPFLPLQK